MPVDNIDDGVALATKPTADNRDDRDDRDGTDKAIIDMAATIRYMRLVPQLEAKFDI